MQTHEGAASATARSPATSRFRISAFRVSQPCRCCLQVIEVTRAESVCRSKISTVVGKNKDFSKAIDSDQILLLIAVEVTQQRKLNLGRQINQATAAKQVNRNIAASAYGGARRMARVDLQK